MGGGAAMRAAAKVAGIGVMNSGIRGGLSSVSSSAEQSVRNRKLPVSAIMSSSSQNKTCGVEIEGFQRPAWEIDEGWEMAGFESEEQMTELNEPLPRLVFGAPPSFEEAKAATCEVKDALEKAYLSSPDSNKTDGSFGSCQLPGLSFLTNSDGLETKNCITCDARANSSPGYAVKAFKLLNESPEAQSIVASIATDPNVWDAVYKNEALQEYIRSQKRNAELQDLGSPRLSSVSFDDASPEVGNGPINLLENIKLAMTEMVNTVSTFVQQIFGVSPAENSAAADANARPSFFVKTLGASFMALVVMVIMVVVLKRR